MLRSMVRFSLRFSWLIAAVGVALIALGAFQLGNARKDLLPEFEPTIVEVQTEALGLSAYEVEQLITVPLEQDLLNGVAFLEHIESASLPGLSSVVMTFEPGTDVLDARQVVSERLTQAVAVAGLPQVADAPQMLQPLSSTSRVALVSLSANNLSQIQQSVLARWVIVPGLLGVDGVANVSIWGFRDRQLQVLVEPERLAAEQLDLADVIRTTGNALEVSPLSFLEASSPGTGGFIDTVNQRLHIFHEQTISTPGELAQVPIEDNEGAAIFRNGEPLLLGEVTDIVEDHQPLIGDARCNDGPCILLVIEKFPEANTPQVVSGVESTLESLLPGLEGMRIDTSIYRPADYIDTTFSNLGLALLVGAVLLAAVLGFAFFDWRTALISLVTIAASLGGAALALVLLNVTLNTMILAGVAMALVLIIDDSVAGVGLVSDRLQHGRVEGNGASAGKTVLGATVDERRPALYAFFIVVALLIPFFFMEGEAGAFFPSIAWAYLAAVAVALIVSLTVAPALSLLLLRNRHAQESGTVARLKEGYGKRRAAGSGKLTVALATGGVLVLVGLLALPFMDIMMRPALQERDLVIDIEGPPGMSLTRMDEIASEMVTDIQTLPGIDNIAAHTGRAILSDQIVDVNSGQVWISLDDEANRDGVIGEIDNIVDRYSEIEGTVNTYSDQRVTQVLDRASNEIVLRVYGEDDASLTSTAEEVRSALTGVSGAAEVALRNVADQDTIEIAVDIDQAQALGLKPGDIRRTAATLLAGLTVGNLFEEQKVFDVVVWGAPELRQSMEDVGEIRITTPSGQQVPLADVADVRVVEAPTVIQHESVSKFRDVVVTVEGRGTGAVASDVSDRVDSLDFPAEFHWAVLGGYAEQESSNGAVLAVGITALIAIYLMFQSAFASWRLATLAFLVVPVALTGSLIATLIFSREMTLGFVAGLIAILGLASRWVVSLIRRYQEMEFGGTPFGAELVTEGTLDRLVTVVASGAAIFAFFLPGVVMSGAVGLEIVGDAAVAVVGGVLTSLAMALIVLPAIYTRWGHVENPDTSAEDLYIDYALEGERV
jgi:Cu/Ag efflux pump CusA